MTALGRPARNAARALAWLLGSLPGVAWACPVCFASKDEANRLAFVATTALLTALPVIMIGGLIVWFARRASEIDQEESAPQPAPALEPEAAVSVQGETVESGELIPLRR